MACQKVIFKMKSEISSSLVIQNLSQFTSRSCSWVSISAPPEDVLFQGFVPDVAVHDRNLAPGRVHHARIGDLEFPGLNDNDIGSTKSRGSRVGRCRPSFFHVWSRGKCGPNNNPSRGCTQLYTVRGSHGVVRLQMLGVPLP